ncbi:MAG: DUF58 domain-containing protein [Pseudomonadota bacterium]
MIALDAKPLLDLRGLVRRARSGLSVTSLPGGLVTRPRGRGLETAELRAFEPGDDPRHLDRNATARTGQPQIRLFHAERDRTTILIADFRPSMLWGTRRTLRSIAAAEALALTGWDAVVTGGRVGLIAVTAADTNLLAPQARDQAMVRVIGGLVQAHAHAVSNPGAEDPDLSVALAMANRAAPRGAEIVLASALDSLGADFQDMAQALSARTQFRVLQIVDAFEIEAPSGRYRFATRSRPEGAVGQPGTVAQTTTPLKEIGLEIGRYDVARPPEQQTLHA